MNLQMNPEVIVASCFGHMMSKLKRLENSMLKALENLLVLAVLGAGLSGSLGAQTPAFKVTGQIALGGEAKWDFLFQDAKAQRLYVSHGSQTEVINTQTKTLLGTIVDTPGVHGVATASDLGLGFTSNGRANTLTVFDLASLKTLSTIAVGANPDAIVYEPQSQRVLSFNGKSKDVSVVDAKTLKLVATVAVNGKPEVAVVAPNGWVYFNIEDTREIAALNPLSAKVVLRKKLKNCESPSGLAMDDQRRFYSVCENHKMVVSSALGEPLGEAMIGEQPDGVAWMDGAAFSSNGGDGTLSIVREVSPLHFETVATLPTALHAKTIASDPLTHTLYLPTADFLPKGEGKPVGVANSFRVLVVQPQN
jgi:YVTN family beta-propeller protein